MMKNIFFFLIATLILFNSCKDESQTESDNINSTDPQLTESDTLTFTFDETKWASLSEESFDSSNSYGYVPPKEKLEKKLKKGFESIDPLEYYLYENKKYTDKKIMRKKQKKLGKLFKVYRENYYELGHMQERKNDVKALYSLTLKKYPDKGINSLPDEYLQNKNTIGLKAGSQKAIKANPEDLKSMLNSAVQLINLSELSAAENTIDFLGDNFPSKDYLVSYNKAYIRFKHADYNQAINYAKESVALREDFYLAYLLIGDSYLNLGLHRKAFDFYNKAQKYKDNIVILERLAYAALLNGDGVLSEKCYSKILDKYHGIGRHNYTAGKALSLAYIGKNEESLKMARELRIIRKKWALPWLIEGWNQLILGKYKEAETAFANSNAFGEKLYSNIGNALVYYCQKDYMSSSMMFYDLETNPAFKKIENHPALLIYSGFSYANTFDFGSSCAKFIDYGQLYQKDNPYYLGMGICSYGFNDFPAAEAYIDSIKSIKNNLGEYHYLKGLYALRNEKFEIAKEAFEKSLQLENNNLKVLNGLGTTLKGLEDLDQAVLVFDKGLNLNPNDPYLLFNKASAIFGLGEKLHRNGSIKQAKDTVAYGISLMNKATSIDPLFYTALNIGNAYANIKDSALAMSYYKQVNNLAAEVNKGSLYASINQTVNAREVWNSVKETDATYTLAEFNLKAVDLPASKSVRFKYYEYYYFEVGYHYISQIPVLFENSFEPLVPLGHANLEFVKVTD